MIAAVFTSVLLSINKSNLVLSTTAIPPHELRSPLHVCHFHQAQKAYQFPGPETLNNREVIQELDKHIFAGY